MLKHSIQFTLSIIGAGLLASVSNATTTGEYQITPLDIATAEAEAKREDSISSRYPTEIFRQGLPHVRGWCQERAFWARQHAVEFDRQAAILDVRYCEVIAAKFNLSASSSFKSGKDLQKEICVPGAIEAQLNQIEDSVEKLGPMTQEILNRPVIRGEFERLMLKRRAQILSHRDEICR